MGDREQGAHVAADTEKARRAEQEGQEGQEGQAAPQVDEELDSEEGLVEGRLERALSILEEIQAGGDEPDRKSLDLLIKASHRAGKIDTETLDLWNQGGMSLEAAVVEASEQGAESVRADERGGSFWSRLTRLF